MPKSSLFERFRRHRHEKRLSRVLLKATRLLSDVIRRNIVGADFGPDNESRLAAEIVELRTPLEAERQTNAILQARIDRIRPRRRPHYSPDARFRILALMNLLGVTVDDIAHRFRITATTVSRWVGELALNPTPERIGAAARCDPPLRRYANAVRELAQTLAALGVGDDNIVRMLAREGLTISSRTVGRIRKEKPTRIPEPPIEKLHVIADYPNHVWSMDLTEIPMLFGFSIELAAIIDNFSRMPVMLRLFFNRPIAADMAALLRRFGIASPIAGLQHQA